MPCELVAPRSDGDAMRMLGKRNMPTGGKQRCSAAVIQRDMRKLALGRDERHHVLLQSPGFAITMVITCA